MLRGIKAWGGRWEGGMQWIKISCKRITALNSAWLFLLGFELPYKLSAFWNSQINSVLFAHLRRVPLKTTVFKMPWRLLTAESSWVPVCGQAPFQAGNDNRETSSSCPSFTWSEQIWLNMYGLGAYHIKSDVWLWDAKMNEACTLPWRNSQCSGRERCRHN